jgi:predicted ATP-grasp superfamily ATP-dependent carboligase
MSRISPPAVVLGMSPTGLAVIRSLGRKGISVIGIDRDPWAIGRFSKYGRFLKVSSHGDWEEMLFQTLLSVASDYQEKPVLFCTEDAYLVFLANYAHKLKEDYRMPSSLNTDTINLFLDKENFYKMCFEQGVELPATYFPKDLGQIEDLAGRLRYPCIIKPSLGHLWRRKLRGKKMVEVNTAQDLITLYKQLSSWDSRLIIQEVIPGGDDCIYIFGGSFDRNSEPLAVFTGRKLRQFPPRYGSASLAESTWEPEVADMSITLLKRLKFHGICGTEFKKDPRDGNFKMMEINLRPTLWFSIIEASGVDVIYAIYQELIGSVAPKDQVQINGIVWIYSARDVISSIFYLLHRGLTLCNWFRSLRNAKAHAIFARDDLRVTAFIPVYLVKEFWQYLITGG